MDPEQSVEIFQSVLDAVDEAFPDYDNSDRLVNAWPKCKEMIPHVAKLSDLFSTSGLTKKASLLKLGELFERAAWYI
jgi:hypothetical protein